MNQTRTVSGVIPLGKSTMACTKGTVRGLGHPAACATRLTAPSAPTTVRNWASSVRPPWVRSMVRVKVWSCCFERNGLFARTRTRAPAACAAA